MALDKRFLLMLAGSQMQVAGSLIQSMDPDSIGRDDVIGKILVTGGRAVNALSAGDFKKVDATLKIIADAINDYLAQGEAP